ncbi:hypothetical protein B0H11DRAFT_1921201 [Mycena galericulata]|nr:hypothetical protein B0H11DRAFT_1921201 [Mycena galericulata]
MWQTQSFFAWQWASLAAVWAAGLGGSVGGVRAVCALRMPSRSMTFRPTVTNFLPTINPYSAIWLPLSEQHSLTLSNDIQGNNATHTAWTADNDTLQALTLFLPMQTTTKLSNLHTTTDLDLWDKPR